MNLYVAHVERATRLQLTGLAMAVNWDNSIPQARHHKSPLTYGIIQIDCDVPDALTRQQFRVEAECFIATAEY